LKVLVIVGNLVLMALGVAAIAIGIYTKVEIQNSDLDSSPGEAFNIAPIALILLGFFIVFLGSLGFGEEAKKTAFIFLCTYSSLHCWFSHNLEREFIVRFIFSTRMQQTTHGVPNWKINGTVLHFLSTIRALLKRRSTVVDGAIPLMLPESQIVPLP